MVTPVPWKLLDDVSIWSQNWSWIPQPTRGPVEVKRSSCTLCANGCGIQIKMAGGWPVGVAGVARHPISKGALCPLAYGAHQLNWHPQRLTTVRHQASTSSWAAAQAAFSKACSEGTVVILDGHAGRAASTILETFAQKCNGSYRFVPSPEERALAPYQEWSGVATNALGYDLENAQTIVSFGAPLLDGWGTPGRFTRLWAEQAAGKTEPQLRLIQIEPTLSRTAARAWQWIPIREGAESALSSGLASIFIEEGLVSAKYPLPLLTLAEAADQSGVSIESIRSLARTIVARPPVVVIARDANPEIAALNVLLGAIAAPGGIVVKSKRAKPFLPSDSVIGSARAVLIDSSVPWEFVPHTDAEVFRFAAWDGGSNRADWLLPAPGFLEELTDIPTAPTSAIETYAVAPALTQSSSDVRNAVQFLSGIDSTLPSIEKIIRTRCEDLFHQHTGSVYDTEVSPLSKFESVTKFEESLWKGAIWVGVPPDATRFRCELKEWPAPTAPPPPENWTKTWAAPVLPPLASKLYQESSLREPPAGRNS